MVFAGGRLVATRVTLRTLLQFAYRRKDGSLLQNYEIIGGPSWMDRDTFDVEGKPEGEGRPIPADQISIMLRSLLEDRFQAKVHLETQELAVYNLIVVKSGLKMNLSEDQNPPTSSAQLAVAYDPSKTPPRGAIWTMRTPSDGQSVMLGTAVPIASLARQLQSPAGRGVVDKTDLKGLFDFRLQFSPDPLSASSAAVPTTDAQTPPIPSDRFGPSIFTALQEQLGLRLDSSKGPVEVLMIESVNKPSEN